MDIRISKLTLLLLALSCLLQRINCEFYDALRKKFANYTVPTLCPKVVCSTDKSDYCSQITNNSLILCPTCCSDCILFDL